MSKKEKIFIIFENKYNDLYHLTQDNNYTVKTMGEITWFLSLMKTLKSREHKIIHCENEFMFISEYAKHAYESDLFLIMDNTTISKMIHCMQGSINKIYCMCYWGRDDGRVRKLGKTPNNVHLNIKNVLTPFNYKNDNTFLGFNMDVLCQKNPVRKYEAYGVLWGKDIEFIDLNLVRHLCRRGVKFYATSQTPVTIDGVTNLGILPKRKWYQLLSDCKFVLGSGHPKSGPTILEALYYKTALIGPKAQFPRDTHNANTHFIDGLSSDEVFNIIQKVKFEPNSKVDELCSSDSFNKRIDAIFDL